MVSNSALAGAAALMLIKPGHVPRLVNSPVIPRALTVGRALLPATEPQRSPADGPWRLIGRYSLARRMEKQKLQRTAGRRLNGSAAMLALSVLADSAVEHYRGSFENRAMYTPLAVAALTLAASLFGVADLRGKRHPVRDLVSRRRRSNRFRRLGVSFLQYRQAAGPIVVAQFVLRGANRRADGARTRGTARARRRAGA